MLNVLFFLMDHFKQIIKGLPRQTFAVQEVTGADDDIKKENSELKEVISELEQEVQKMKSEIWKVVGSLEGNRNEEGKTGASEGENRVVREGTGNPEKNPDKEARTKSSQEQDRSGSGCRDWLHGCASIRSTEL